VILRKRYPKAIVPQMIEVEDFSCVLCCRSDIPALIRMMLFHLLAVARECHFVIDPPMAEMELAAFQRNCLPLAATPSELDIADSARSYRHRSYPGSTSTDA
jgi:hypothetical protein